MPSVFFESFDGSERREIRFNPDQSVLEIAQSGGIEMEGTCEACMACSTCHVILKDKDYGRFPAPEEEEADMLDLAYGRTRTSRLGCQLVLAAAHDGLVIRLPEEIRSMMD